DQLLLLLVSQFAQHTHRVLALSAVTRMHEPVSQIARRGQNQQALGIEIEAPYRQPLTDSHFGQAGTNRRTPRRVVVADDFASWLVIKNNAWRLGGIGARDGATIDTHLIVRPNALANMRRLAIDGHSPGNNQLFHFASRTNTSIG